MPSVLEEVASTAEHAARDQEAVARRVRSMQEQRERGWSWRRIMDREGQPGVFEMLRRSSRAISGSATRLAAMIAGELAAEGESRRLIASRLGVTHQRISAILARRSPDAGEEHDAAAT